MTIDVCKRCGRLPVAESHDESHTIECLQLDATRQLIEAMTLLARAHVDSAPESAGRPVPRALPFYVFPGEYRAGQVFPAQVLCTSPRFRVERLALLLPDVPSYALDAGAGEPIVPEAWAFGDLEVGGVYLTPKASMDVREWPPLTDLAVRRVTMFAGQRARCLVAARRDYYCRGETLYLLGWDMEAR